MYHSPVETPQRELVAGLVFLGGQGKMDVRSLADRTNRSLEAQGMEIGQTHRIGRNAALLEVDGQLLRLTLLGQNGRHAEAADAAGMPEACSMVQLAAEGSGRPGEKSWEVLARATAFLADEIGADFVQWPEASAAVATDEMTSALSHKARQPQEFSAAATDRLRLATWMMTLTVSIFALPLGAALAIINLFKGEDLRLTAQVMALTGLIVTEATFGVSGYLAPLVSI